MAGRVKAGAAGGVGRARERRAGVGGRGGCAKGGVEGDEVFRLLFERSGDPIWLFDPERGVFVDCNESAVRLMRCESRAQMMEAGPAMLSPARQLDGRASGVAAAEITRRVEAEGGLRFEWLGRRFDGSEVPLEVTATPLQAGGRRLHVVMARDITERRRAEEEIRRLNATLEERVAVRTAALAASEERLRTLLVHAPEAIVVFDGVTGCFLTVNENALALYGLSRGQLLRSRPWDLSPERQPDGRSSEEAARDWMRRALAGEAPVFEWVHRHASGRLIPCEIRLVRLPGEGPACVRGSVIDNTERRRRERVQEAIYRIGEAALAVADLPALFAELHAIVRGLMAAENFYIALREDRMGRITFPYFVDERMACPEPIGLDTGLTGVVLRTGKPLLVRSGRVVEPGVGGSGEREVELEYREYGEPAAIWLGVPLTSHGGAFGVMAVQDYERGDAYGEEERQILTFMAGQVALAIERKRSEEALRDSEEKFRALFEASSQGVLIQDEERFLEVNPAAARVLGFGSPADLVGKGPRDTSPPFQPGGEPSEVVAQRQVVRCMEQGSTRFEWLSRRPGGGDFPVDVILTRIEMRGRRLIQAVVDDISQRKRAEAELLRALAREKELSQLKSDFVSLVSHEFRTPLGIIASSAEILRDYLGRLEEGERREHLESITKNVRRMAELMEEVLLLGRFEAGKIDFKPLSLDLRLAFHRLVDEVMSATGDRCPIRLELGDLPAEARADDRLLRHVFTNLLSNAVKYSGAGEPVEFRVWREKAEAVAVIRDRGIGIPDGDRPWLFQAFHRGRNVGQRPGSGLGLVVVKRCVELHGGRVELESHEGRGTTVMVRLPVFGADADGAGVGGESSGQEYTDL
jgi:PAS domain S-box-containing protein